MNSIKTLQNHSNGQLKHLLSIAKLTSSQLFQILDTAESLSSKPLIFPKINKTCVNLFFEPSTRTRNSFEFACKRLGLDVFNINIDTSSSIKKGETLLDTVNNLTAMGFDLFVIRHPSAGAPEFIAHHISTPATIINAGDGCHEHPSQALLDLYTIRHHKKDFKKLRIAIVGDILHSRVARSLIFALTLVNVPEINVVAPHTLLPDCIKKWGVNVCSSIEEGIDHADVVVTLRLQHERMESVYIPSKQEYFQLYGLTSKRLAIAKKDVIVMHPGPINRGVEISSEVADGPHSVILDQVKWGVFVRMAIIAQLLNIDLRGAQ